MSVVRQCQGDEIFETPAIPLRLTLNRGILQHGEMGAQSRRRRFDAAGGSSTNDGMSTAERRHDRS